LPDIQKTKLRVSYLLVLSYGWRQEERYF
jgi:hypothetical protein